MGGIMTAEDALEFILAGATAVSVGTANFCNPHATIDIVNGIEDYMRAKNVNDMVEVVSMPVCAADFPSGREAAMLPGLVDIMQGYIAKSLQGNFSGIGSYVTPLSKSARRKAVIAEEDIAPAADSAFREKIAQKGIDIESGDVADSLFLAGDSRTLVSYVITPTEPHKGAVCWKILIDARTHELFYYKRHTVTGTENAGFLKGDLKKIAKTR